MMEPLSGDDVLMAIIWIGKDVIKMTVVFYYMRRVTLLNQSQKEYIILIFWISYALNFVLILLSKIEKNPVVRVIILTVIWTGKDCLAVFLLSYFLKKFPYLLVREVARIDVVQLFSRYLYLIIGMTFLLNLIGAVLWMWFNPYPY